MNDLGNRVKEIRSHYKLSQKKFAEKLLVTPSYISMVENGKETPSPLFIKLVTLEFHISYEWLNTGIGSMQDISNDPFYDNKVIKETVDTTLEFVLDRLEKSIQNLTDYDRHNLLDIIGEINHILNLNTTTVAQKSLLFDILRNFVCLTSTIIDRFAITNIDDELDKESAKKRFEEYIKNSETILNQIKDVYLYFKMG
jgi:transcriptional regulator with XRE-family HTH domain